MIPKLSNLTPTDKIRLAAELDGYEYVTTCKVTGNLLFKTSNPNRTRYCPDYSTSYNAIIPLIQKQKQGVRVSIGLYLSKQIIPYADAFVDYYYQTPSQLLDALLVATGKATI